MRGAVPSIPLCTGRAHVPIPTESCNQTGQRGLHRRPAAVGHGEGGGRRAPRRHHHYRHHCHRGRLRPGKRPGPVRLPRLRLGHASGEGAPANPYQGTNSWTETTGESVDFAFTGTQLTFRAITDPGHGIGAVSVDGGTPVDVDLYSATRTGDVPVWTSPTLSDGPHTFTLTSTGRKNAASSGTALTVDRIDFVGEAPVPGKTDVAVDEALAPAAPSTASAPSAAAEATHGC
ncbi:hypothetical protein SALBM311S_00776 [Streptomyces alboniger]